MKIKWFSKILTSLVVLTLVFSTASFASAKSSDKGNTEQKGNDQGQKKDKSSNNRENNNNQKEDKSIDLNDKEPKGKEDKSSNVKEKSKKEIKKKTVIKSNMGKVVEKRLGTIDSSINSISKSINSYFGVNDDGTVNNEVIKKTANKRYSSYIGKLESEINKLRAIEKQLAFDKKKYKANASEFEALVVNSKELQKIAADEIKRVKSLAEQAVTPKLEDENTNSPGETLTPTESAPPTEPRV